MTGLDCRLIAIISILTAEAVIASYVTLSKVELHGAVYGRLPTFVRSSVWLCSV